MHYCNIVIVDRGGDIERRVERAMGPHEEEGGFWDWYVIGGRWHGMFSGERNPNRDQYSKGVDERDVIPVEQLTEDHINVFRIVYDSENYGRGHHESERYVPWESHPKCFEKQEMPPLAWLKETFKGCLAVVVDNHK